MKTIAIQVSKGGVGKTTTAVNLAAVAAKDGARVLLVDCDPQGNSGFGLGHQDDVGKTIMAAMDGDKLMADVISHNCYGIDLAPAPVQARYQQIEQQPIDLRNALEQVSDLYDVCIIDMGPGYSDLTVNALVAADYVLIPTQADAAAYKSVKDTLGLINMAREANPKLELLGILLTRWRTRDKVQTAMADAIAAWSEAGYRVLETKIRECTGLRQAAAAQQPITEYLGGKSVGTEDYTALWQEIKQYINN